MTLGRGNLLRVLSVECVDMKNQQMTRYAKDVAQLETKKPPKKLKLLKVQGIQKVTKLTLNVEQPWTVLWQRTSLALTAGNTGAVVLPRDELTGCR